MPSDVGINIGDKQQGTSQCSNEYEQLRADRIARNKQVLVEMGLIGAVQRLQKCDITSRKAMENEAGSAGRGQRKSQCQSVRPPARTSLRLRGQQPPGVASLELPDRKRSGAPGEQRQQRCQVSLDQHNLHRIRTMSEAALLRRIHKIQRCDKLASFIQVLQAEHMMDLAKEAEAALEYLTRNVP